MKAMARCGFRLTTALTLILLLIMALGHQPGRAFVVVPLNVASVAKNSPNGRNMGWRRHEKSVCFLHLPTRDPIRFVDGNTHFINHERAEAAERDAQGLLGKINEYEVQMAVGIVCRVLQQSKRPQKVVVLTQYVSQLIQIRKALVLNQVCVELKGADRARIVMREEEEFRGQKLNKYPVQLSTFSARSPPMDATCFVVSLVCSNGIGDAGLLSKPAMINFLFTLPNVPKYLIGNMDTLTSSSLPGRAIWQGYKATLDRQHQISEHFPIVCSKHKMVSKIKEPKDFAARIVSVDGCSFGNLSSELSAFACSCLADPVQPLRITPSVEMKGHNNRLQPNSLCDAELKYVLGVYSDRGALQADNALDQIIAAHQGKDPSTTQGFKALQYILHNELGFQEDFSILHASSFPSQSLAASVCCWALYSYLKSRHSIEAHECASRILSFNELHPSALPQRWVDQASKAVACSAASGPIVRNTVNSKIEVKLTVEEQLKRIVIEDPKAPVVLNRVHRMIGSQDVKNTFISLYHRFRLATEQEDQAGFLYNARIEGSPGTGKTTTARNYAAFLKQLGVVPRKSELLEISGSILANEGTKHVKNALTLLGTNGGGVILIDDAFPLLSTSEGKAVLDFIVPVAEEIDSEYGSIVWILSGIQKDMEQVFSYRMGLPARFPIKFKLHDFNDDDLLQLFNDMLIYQPANSRAQLKAANISLALPRPQSGELDDFFSANPNDGERRIDSFGYSWTSKNGSWHNDFGGICQLTPGTVGLKPHNPLVVAGTAWNYDLTLKHWSSKDGMTMTEYPTDVNIDFEHPLRKRKIPFRLENCSTAPVAIRRLGRQRGDPGFDNARAVQRLFDQVRSRQAQRIRSRSQGDCNPDIFLFTRDDILGPSVTVEVLRSSAAYQELQALEGLTAVKESVDSLIKLAAENARREEDGKPLLDIVTNRVFLGNPGTGKTTVAGIYGRLLAQMGLLSKGEVLLRSPSDFVGDVVGSSEKRTRDILSSAQGCVLVIDEAYSLHSSGQSYGLSVINTIVEQVSAKPGDDRAILLLGYKEEMMYMLKNANPGLTRRFQLENAFEFEDYDDEALLRILLSKVKHAGLKIDFAVAKRAVASLGKARARPHFGNAGEVESMLSEAKLKLNPGEDKLTLADFGLEDDTVDNRVLDSLLNDLVGCEAAKSKLQELRDTVMFARARGDDPKEHIGFNYLFLGNPGTGKSTVARRMGTMFKALGLLPSDEVRDFSAADLVTGFAGQTGRKTREVLQSSRGGVLVIDEAYQLNPTRGGTYMAEALDELVKCLSSPEFQGKILVILAGYNKDMEQMLAMNTGLKSRFPDRLQFEDISVNQAAELMVAKMASRKLEVTDCPTHRLLELASRLVKLRDFSNGRDVDTWSAMVYQVVSRKARTEAVSRRSVTFEEMEKALNKLVRSRNQEIDFASPTPSTNVVEGAQQSTVQLAFRTTLRQAEAEVKLGEKSDLDQATLNLELQDYQTNPFVEVDSKVLLLIQDALNSMGKNTNESVTKISLADASDPAVRALIEALKAGGVSPEQAEEQVQKWQSAHKELGRQVEEAKREQKKRGAIMRAIWRCWACGRGGYPWIVCNVAPYIERFESIPQDD